MARYLMCALAIIALHWVGQAQEAGQAEEVALPRLTYPALHTYADLTSASRTDLVGRVDSVSEAKVRMVDVGRDSWRPDPTKAILWGLLPGGGQIYNRKYWKLPIVWGALMSCFYAVQWNQMHYDEYHAAYKDFKSENPAVNTAWLAFAPRGTAPEDYEQLSYLSGPLKRGNDYFRRYRDISIVVGILVYGLSILDAYVDAELYTFDISPDLTMRLSPIVEIAPQRQYQTPYQVGVACSFNF